MRDKLHININLNIRGMGPSATLAINEMSNRMIKEGREVFKLGLGQSPFPVPEPVVEALRQNAHQKEYLPVKGLPELQEAIANFNLRKHNLRCTPEDVLIGPGSKELIFLLQLVYYGDLIIPTPSWVSYSPQARIVGRNVNWIPTKADNNWRLSPDMLEMICRTDPTRPRIAILNYPANPTGYTYPLERLERLAHVARRYGVILVSDEIYGLIHHNGKHVSVANYYPEGTIVSSGMSKWCGAGGWRLGCFTFPAKLRWLLDAIASVASETYTATSSPIQYAAITAFEENSEIENYLLHSRRILKTIAKVLVDKLRNMEIDIQLPQGAFYLFPDFNPYRGKLEKYGIYTSGELCKRILEKTGVAMLPGSDFGRPPEELTTRISYVDFDGANALETSGKIPVEKELNSTFMKENCPKLVKAFDLLGDWLAAL
ncbi:MAG: aspartate aminotransferase [Bacteroides sp. SM23_62_1]|nr:MAG: aspartate aminotransferase [Bacteroides sp. SM23_62_1]